MRRTRTVFTALILTGVALALVFSTTGCRKQPKITSAWPTADKERTVPEPPAALVYPYRGTQAPEADSVTRRPLSVKIENSPQARPQTGLSRADVVYETIAEGGITRFNCIFHSDVPDVIGPVRSARLSDLWIVPQYDALFFFSGASTGVNSAIRKAGLPNLSEDAGVTKPYSRSTRKAAPHNLFLDGTQMYSTAQSRDMRVTSKPVPLQYMKRAKPATETISEVVIPFSQANISRWVYDAKTKTYARFNNGRPHLDEGSSEQIDAENVVVMWVEYTSARRDKVGSNTWNINLGGKGRVSVFHGGQRYDGTWHADKKSPPRFKNASGDTIRLVPGRTWFHAIPLNVDITMK